MEEAVVKQGVLYLQLQQTFGKKWRKFWGVLYRESSCSTARLELFEGSVPPAAEKLRKGEGSQRLGSDCVHVAEVSGDAGCPKETVPFLLETTDKRYLLAADGTEAASWIQKLCELAFPRSREEQAASKDGQQSSLGTDGGFSMEENSLYSSRHKAGVEQTFEVTVRATESSERCRLWGRGILRAGEEALELLDFQALEIIYSWPYRFLRRFGRDKGHEELGGIKCPSLDPTWEGKVPKNKPVMPSSSCPGAGEPSGTFPPSRSADCPYSEPCNSLRRGTPQVPEKPQRQDALAKVATESEYAIPFDTIAKTFVA
ncbi:PREDICTED: docking protein 2, partial [Eurypyga helias]|uniref:docking protein 2 n=1 Tax=Eurypyga helias TaxID=54383 RepID=UPI00052842E1